MTGLIARIVHLLKSENPSLGKMKVECHDGSKVTLLLSKRSVSELRCSGGLWIDGETPEERGTPAQSKGAEGEKT